MANDCRAAHVHACLMRIGRIDTDGTPLPGADGIYVSDAIVSVEITPSVVEGTSITRKNGCGVTAIDLEGDPSISRYDAVFALLTPDPYLHEILSSGLVLTEGAAVGYQFPRLNVPLSHAVSIEFWVHRLDDTGTDYDADLPYARYALPKFKSGRPGVRNHQDDALDNPISGKLLENPNWGNGPENDWTADSSGAVQWLPVSEDDLPDVSCEYQEMVAS